LIPCEPHDEFLELCAVSTSGQLNEDEQIRLREHLAVCPSCREAAQQYEALVVHAISTMAAAERLDVDPGPSWSQTKAEKSLFSWLAADERQRLRQECNMGSRDGGAAAYGRIFAFSTESIWRHVWTLYAAGILLFVTLSFCAYWVGIRRGTETAKFASKPDGERQSELQQRALLEKQLSDAARDREITQAQILQRDEALADLHQRLERQAAETGRMKEAQDRLESDLRNGESDKRDLVQQRTELAESLEAAQSESQALARKLDSLAHELAQQTADGKASEAKVKDLIRHLQDRDNAIEQRDQLLAHDRDIRELMGARDVYIAEVYDVGDNGAAKKPYGRVFYTKDKSLIFYAYDLDQQAGIRLAKTFQAWGRRGPDQRQALNLGIFYEDNASKKRWVLKLDDPKMLKQIDAVFVTVEPNGGSHKPSGKPLLFAYLGVDPNHP
jgi:Putative zinc-finger